jgi:hypothetical protein
MTYQGPDLRPITNALNDVLRNQQILDRKQDHLQNAVSGVQQSQDQTNREVQDIRAVLDTFIRRDELQKNLQLAQTQIIEVRQELNTHYGHFGDVRRLATGTLQALDAGIVSHGTMRELSEELMLLAPRYWLAPALVALAAWIRDDPDLAGKALNEAVRRDNDKASLFFALTLRRHQRDSATARWISQYTARQDPAALSREFTVVLDAVATGAFGREAKPVVLEHMGDWYTRLCADQGTVDKQVARWAQMIDTLRRPISPQYRILPVISPTWPQLKELYEGATVHGAAEEMFRALFTGPVPQSDDLRVRVDDILTRLVGGFDAEEAPLRRKEAGLQAIVDADGDKDKASQVMRVEDPLHEQTTDFLTLLSNAALHGERAQVSLGTRRLAVSLARDWAVQGAGRLEAANMQAMPDEVQLAMEGWTDVVDASANEERLVHSLTAHIKRETDAEVAKVRFTGAPLAGAIFGGIALFIALIAAIDGGAGFATFLLIVAAVLGIWCWTEARGLPARREEIRKRGAQRTAHAVAQLRGGLAELVDLRREWEQVIGQAASFRQYAESLNSTAFVANAPDQKRGA